MNWKFFVSSTPSFVLSILTLVSLHDSSAISKWYIYAGIAVCFMLLPFTVYKYNTLKQKIFPTMYHLKAECALLLEYNNILDSLLDSSSGPETVKRLSQLMVTNVAQRLEGRYGGDAKLKGIAQTMRKGINGECDVQQCRSLLKKAHTEIERILKRIQEKEGMQEILYPSITKLS